MSLLRLVGRPMLASMFVAGGLNSLRDPEAVAPVAEPVVQPVTERVEALPDRTEQVVRLSGAVQVAAGVLLGIGRVPRVAALAIAGTLVPTTIAGHRFWEAEDSAEREQQLIHFLKNLSMLGGLLIAADDTAGHPRCGGEVATPPMTCGGTHIWCAVPSEPPPGPPRRPAACGPNCPPDRP